MAVSVAFVCTYSLCLLRASFLFLYSQHKHTQAAEVVSIYLHLYMYWCYEIAVKMNIYILTLCHAYSSVFYFTLTHFLVHTHIHSHTYTGINLHAMVAAFRNDPENKGFDDEVKLAVQELEVGDAKFHSRPPEVRSVAGWVVGGKLI